MNRIVVCAHPYQGTILAELEAGGGRLWRRHWVLSVWETWENAANLLRAGFGLRVYNRTAAKAAPLVAKGAAQVASEAEVAQSGGIVLTMLADDRAVEEVTLREHSFVEGLGAGGIHISLSTIAPATARRLAEHHAKHKVEYVAAPVFGRPEAAAAARLWVCT
jgi:3-hydroxyisobutyrate dehydrogenase-like beta-hydroxyacid dehydrogenase